LSEKSAQQVLKNPHILLLYSLLYFNSSLIWPTNYSNNQTMKLRYRQFPHWLLNKFNNWKARGKKMGWVGNEDKEISNLIALVYYYGWKFN